MTILQTAQSADVNLHSYLTNYFKGILDKDPERRRKDLKRAAHQLSVVLVLAALAFMLSQWIFYPLALLASASIIFSVAFTTAVVTTQIEARRA